MAGERKYPDLRYLFMRGLINHERDQRCHHYLKSAAECTSRAIVSLELTDEPVRSVKQARRLEGIGGETCSRLTKLEKEKEYSCLKPLAGRFVSSAGGILLALLEATEEMIYNGKSADKSTCILVPEECVKRRAIRLTEEQFADGPNEFCKAWWRVEVLIKRGYIRRRSQKKAPVLQLLPIGKETAATLRDQSGLAPTVPGPSCKIPTIPSIPPVMKRETTVSSTLGLSDFIPLRGETTPRLPELEDALYTNDRGRDGIVMLVDRREMGGERAGLGELCGLLGDNGICYKTKHLKAGDYSWVWRVNGEEIVLPCLVERKRADDIARTLKESRFWSQVNKMKHWKHEYTERGIQCALHYILEGKPEQYVVRCEDGCQGIIQCGNPTLPQVKLVIEDLKRHPDLLVKETDNLHITVILLTSLTGELNERMKKGDFDCLLQSALSTKKSKMVLSDKGAVSSLAVDEVSTVADTGVETSNNLESVDFSFDEELQMAIERSKREISKAHSVLNSVSDMDSEDNKDLAKRETGKSSVVVLEDDEDAELAAVLERSKYETHGRIDDLVETNSHPLMQYHCTEGESLHYPSTSSSGKAKDYNANTYRPKINKKQIPSCTIAINNFDTTYSSDVTHLKHFAGPEIGNFKSTSVKNVNATKTAIMIGEDFLDTNAISNSVRKEYQPMFGFHEDKKPGKRKYPKKDLVFRPDENNVEESYSSCSDSECSSRKKSKKVPFTFTPSKDFVENNLMQVTLSRNDSTEDDVKFCKNTGSRLGEVYKMRKDYSKNLYSEETEPSSLYCENVSGTTKAKCVDACMSMEPKEKGVGKENIETCRYNSDDDLFTDVDDTERCEIKANPSSNLANTFRKSTDFREKKLQKSRFDNNLDDKFERIEASSEDISDLDVSGSENVDTEIVGNLSLSESSDGTESLPDIGLGVVVRNKNVLKDFCTADGYVRSREESDSVSGSSSYRTRVNADPGRQKRFDSGYDSDTRASVNGELTEDNVTLVVSVLPHIDVLLAREMLKKCNNNVDMCVAELLETNSESL